LTPNSFKGDPDTNASANTYSDSDGEPNSYFNTDAPYHFQIKRFPRRRFRHP
jgi:hypothetical protein